MGDHKVNTNALRQKILDLAIHGKLVKQDPADEPASVMLEKLRAEKEAKIAAGEIKRNKNDSYIFKYTGTSGENKTDNNPEGLEHNRHYEKFADGRVKDIEDEIPFAVPEGWVWCRLGEICDYGKCQNIAVSELKSEDWILDLEDIEKDSGKIIAFYSFAKRKSESTKHIFKKGDLLYSKLRPYLNKVVIAPKDGFCTSEILPLNFNGTLLNEFAQRLLMSPFFLSTVNMLTYGVKMPRLGTDDAKKIFIPIPPLSEQQRIVEKIEEIFAQIDLLEQNKTDLQTAIKQAKSKILDLAIHGKLVPQDSNDEPASVMLEKLRAEQEAKIAAGEMKRSKNDSYIYRNPTDNSYYEKFDDGTEVAIEIDSIIPEAWVWCYFSDIADVINGKNQSKVKEGAGKYPIYGSGGIIGYANDYICPENCTIIGRKGSINNPIFIEEKFWNVDTAFGLVPSSIILPRYLFYFCKSFDFTSLDSSTTLPSLTKTNIQHILFPLPPFAAQQRILDKIDELFSQLDKISLNIV